MRAESRAGLLASLKWGAIVGAVVYVVGIVLGLFDNSLLTSGTSDVTQRPILLVPVCLGFFVLLFACSAAGFYTGRESGQAGMGAVAGMVVYLVSNLLTIVYLPGRGFGSGSIIAVSSVSTFIYNLLGLVLDLGIAASMGWLGGRPGARRSPLAAKPLDTLDSLTASGDPYAAPLAGDPYTIPAPPPESPANPN